MTQDALGCLLQEKEWAEERNVELEQTLIKTEKLKAVAESKYNNAVAAPSEDITREKVESSPAGLDLERGAQEAVRCRLTGHIGRRIDKYFIHCLNRRHGGPKAVVTCPPLFVGSVVFIKK